MLVSFEKERVVKKESIKKRIKERILPTIIEMQKRESMCIYLEREELIQENCLKLNLIPIRAKLSQC